MGAIAAYKKKTERIAQRGMLIIKKQGSGAFCRKLIQKLSLLFYEKRNTLIFERILSEPFPENLPKIKAKVRIATSKDMDELAEARGQEYGATDWWRSKFRKRLEDGKLCFVGLQEGEFAFNLWISLDDEYDPVIKRTIRVGKGEGYTYDMWWVYKYRSKRIVYTTVEFVFDYLRGEKGIEKVFGLVGQDNIAVRRIHETFASYKVGEVDYLRILMFKHYSFENENVRRRFV